MFVINDTLGAYGGSHTLMLRMCKWLSMNGIKSAIICDVATNDEIVNQLNEYGTQIICTNLYNIKEAAATVSGLLEQEPIKVVSFNFYSYLNLESVKKRAGLAFDHFMYCIHPRSFDKGASISNRFLKKIYLGGYRRLYLRMHHNNAVIMMDKINEEASNNIYNVHEQFPIIPLPMFCDKSDDAESIITNGYSSNLIMTAARAEFPFKGYIIGLIDDFAELKKDYPSLKLSIVSAGDDIDEVKEKIEALPTDIARDVELVSWLPYEKLLETIKACKVFVGMGTSVLDAALQFKPGVVVEYDTYENISDHLIAEAPDRFTLDKGCRERAIEIIRRVLSLDADEYHKEALRSFLKVSEYYDINYNMKKFLECKNIRTKSVLNIFDYCRHIVNNHVNYVRNKKKRVVFDWRKVNKQID
ncbi:MAG: glycosyltransferase [Lachnospiraceae bacterium]|nr:glycosyltransferase [Lachnospiraceae bacterium]